MPKCRPRCDWRVNIRMELWHCCQRGHGKDYLKMLFCWTKLWASWCNTGHRWCESLTNLLCHCIILKKQSLQFKWKKSRRWSKNTSPQCAMFFTECWSFEMFQLCIFSVALSSTSNEGNLCDSRGLNKGWNWTQGQCICLFKEIMTRLLKVVHRPCYEQFHIGTMLYWTTSSNQAM